MNQLTNHQFLILNGHTGWVNAIAFSPSGNFVASGGDDKCIFLWQARNGQLVKQIKTSSSIKTITFNKKETIVAVGGPGRVIELFEIETGSLISTLSGHTSMITCLVFCNEGKSIISGCDAEELNIWDWSTGKCLNSLFFDECTIDNVDLNSSETKLLVDLGGRRNEVLIYDISQLQFHAKSINNNSKDWGYEFRDAQFSVSGDLVFTLNSDNTHINIWNSNSGYPQKNLKFNGYSYDTFSVYDKEHLVVGDINGSVSIINYVKNQILPIYYSNSLQINPIEMIAVSSKTSSISVLHYGKSEIIIMNIGTYYK